MADTNHYAPGHEPVESDGINYRGLVAFMVILALTTIVCEGIVVGMYKFFDKRYAETTPQRAVMAVPQGTLPPPPNLLTDEPGNLKRFRTGEEQVLDTYGWADKNAGIVRIPVDRAKELLLERGFPVEGRSEKAEDRSPSQAGSVKAEGKK